MRQAAAVLGILGLLSACATGASSSSGALGRVSGSWMGRFNGGTTAALRGEARIIPLADPEKIRVLFELRSVNPSARLPWSIRSGRCGETSAVILTPPALPHIDARPDRTASLRADIALALDPAGEYHVTLGAGVHAPNDVIACGPLTFVP